MVTLGYVLMTLGCVAALVGEVLFLTLAFRRSLWWLLGCLFIPIVSLVFFCLNVRATIRPVALSLVGTLIACLGARLAGMQL
jgi:hypothetical protein